MFRRCHSREIFDVARLGARRGWNLARPSPAEFAQARAWLSPDHRTGFMVTTDGELVNLFNYGTPGNGRNAVRLAIAEGARHLNCFDGFLVEYYRQFGFVEAGRIGFVAEFAQPGTPPGLDVVYMEHRPVRDRAAHEGAFEALWGI